ncbi:hypothetical protein HDU67_001563 [Dinochytrium kinnereticum]|nr:hypothetical protein HDU67_001563 [Dinochytrium kinnereticum]
MTAYIFVLSYVISVVLQACGELPGVLHALADGIAGTGRAVGGIARVAGRWGRGVARKVGRLYGVYVDPFVNRVFDTYIPLAMDRINHIRAGAASTSTATSSSATSPTNPYTSFVPPSSQTSRPPGSFGFFPRATPPGTSTPSLSSPPSGIATPVRRRVVVELEDGGGTWVGSGERVDDAAVRRRRRRREMSPLPNGRVSASPLMSPPVDRRQWEEEDGEEEDDVVFLRRSPPPVVERAGEDLGSPSSTFSTPRRGGTESFVRREGVEMNGVVNEVGDAGPRYHSWPDPRRNVEPIYPPPPVSVTGTPVAFHHEPVDDLRMGGDLATLSQSGSAEGDQDAAAAYRMMGGGGRRGNVLASGGGTEWRSASHVAYSVNGVGGPRGVDSINAFEVRGGMVGVPATVECYPDPEMNEVPRIPTLYSSPLRRGLSIGATRGPLPPSPPRIAPPRLPFVGSLDPAPIASLGTLEAFGDNAEEEVEEEVFVMRKPRKLASKTSILSKASSSVSHDSGYAEQPFLADGN